MKFYICKHCGNVITKLTSAQVPVKCCGEEMHVPVSYTHLTLPTTPYV